MGTYKLYTDKPTEFECKVELSGASIANAKARVIVEASDKTLLFSGTVGRGGKCTIPISKLRGLLPESAKGTLRLEVIVDDTYFQPWESPFEVTASKKLTVEVASPQPVKARIKVKVADPIEQYMSWLTEEVVTQLKESNINSSNVLKRKRYVTSVIKEAAETAHTPVNVHSFVARVINRLSRSGE